MDEDTGGRVAVLKEFMTYKGGEEAGKTRKSVKICQGFPDESLADNKRRYGLIKEPDESVELQNG